MNQKLTKEEIIFHLTCQIFEIIHVHKDIVSWCDENRNERIICYRDTLPAFVYAFQCYMYNTYDSLSEKNRESVIDSITNFKNNSIMTDAFLTMWMRKML